MTTAKTTKAASVKVKAAVAKVKSDAAVIPLVNTKTKKVYIRLVKGNGEKSVEATKKALENKKVDFFEGSARIFVKAEGIEKLTLWKSRVAMVQRQRVTKSAANQIAFWKRNGFEVVNEKEFIVEVAKATETPAAEVQAAVDAANAAPAA